MATKFRRRWQLQSLENRWAPAFFTVTNLLNSGAGSLRQAVLDANALAGADVIDFDLSGTITLTSEISITGPVTITGDTVSDINVSGSNSVRIFNTSAAPAGTAINFIALDLFNGKAATGAALAVGDENISFTDGSISFCTATTSGGGVDMSGAGELIFSNSTISNCSSPSGGGITCNAGGKLLMSNCTVSSNDSTTNSGGGIRFVGAPTQFLLRQCTISGNSAGVTGGGIGLVTSSGSFLVDNSTVVNNSATTNGGGIGRNSGTGTIDCLSTIVSNNTAPSGTDLFTTGQVLAGNCAIGSSAGVTTFTPSGTTAALLGQNFKLGVLSLANGGTTATHLPAKDSPVVNQGSAGAFADDQRGTGYGRSRGGKADVGAVEARTDFVVLNDADSGSGSLRQAILNANAFFGRDSIVFDPLFAATDDTITLTSGEMAINEQVVILGPGATAATISGNNLSRVFNTSGAVTDSDIDIFDLTITGGKAAGTGGAILISDENLLISDCRIIGNSTTGDGGAISVALSDGVLTVRSSEVSGNIAGLNGGGVNFDSAGVLFVEDSTISGNMAGSDGGGIYFFNGGSISINRSTISGNTAGVFGGGLYFFGAIGSTGFNILNSTFAGNKAQSGGAMTLFGSLGAPLIRNCTVTNNTATLAAGGIYTSTAATLVLQSSISSGNNAPNGPDAFNNSTGGFDFTRCALGSTNGIFAISGGDNLPVGIDLKLGPLANNGGPTMTHLPAFDSPLVNAGYNAAKSANDQRGSIARQIGPGVDIGSVEVQYTSVVSIVRADPNPTSLAAVDWTVTLAQSVTGLTAANFNLTGSGASGASITAVTGGGTTWNVAANTGVDGLLGLNLVNFNNLNQQLNNLPFVGETYSVDKVALAVSSLTYSSTSIADVLTGAAKLHIDVQFNEVMDQSVAPVVSFPAENPGATLQSVSSAWLNATTFRTLYNVNDFNLNLQDVDVRVQGGKNQTGATFGTFNAVNAIDIDMANPIVLGMSRNDPSANKLATVGWTVTFSETVTGVTASNFVLFNGGLGGSVTITEVTGSGTTWTVKASTGTGQGTLALYAVNSTGVTDSVGNSLAALPVAGPGYVIDHLAPQAAQLLTNTLTVRDANVGPMGFQVTVVFNEIMDQLTIPTVTFPVENPGATLSLANSQWLDAKTFRATYAVADLNVEIADIDVRVTGGKDVVGNVQTPLNVVDLFDIDTKNPTVALVTIGDGTLQRSRIGSLTVTFSEVLAFPGLAEDAFMLMGPMGGVSLSADLSQSTPTQTIAKLTVSGGSTEFGSLKDGKYTLTVLANQVLDVVGNPTAGNHTTMFHRLFGDADGNGSVTATDFNAFRLAYGSTGSSIFDFNNDNSVSALDFNAFRLRYGTMI